MALTLTIPQIKAFSCMCCGWVVAWFFLSSLRKYLTLALALISKIKQMKIPMVMGEDGVSYVQVFWLETEPIALTWDRCYCSDLRRILFLAKLWFTYLCLEDQSGQTIHFSPKEEKEEHKILGQNAALRKKEGMDLESEVTRINLKRWNPLAKYRVTRLNK